MSEIVTTDAVSIADAAKGDELSKKVHVTALFCLVCGHEQMTFNRWRHGMTASLTCQHCGAIIDVKNALVNTKIEMDRIDAAAFHKQASTPPPEMKTSQEQRDAAKANRPKSEDGWCQMGFRITFGQREVVRQALEQYRTTTGLTGKVWHGTALEHICAEFIAGNSAPRARPDANSLTPEGLAKLSGPSLDTVLLAVFNAQINRMYSSDDEKRKWISENIPPEFANDEHEQKPAKARKRKAKKDGEE